MGIAPNFELEGFTVSLIDRPGFDHDSGAHGSGTGLHILKGIAGIFKSNLNLPEGVDAIQWVVCLS